MKRTPLANRLTRFLVMALGIMLGSTGQLSAQEKLPPGTKLVRIEAHPSAIELKTPFAYSQVLLTGTLDSGDKVDVTRLAQAQAPAFVKISPQGQVRPTADGSGELKFTLDGQTVTLP